jgi:hypothetical protein
MFVQSFLEHVEEPSCQASRRNPDGYGDTGFQATALIFPTEGCREVAGEVADTRVRFVTRVVRVKGRAKTFD